MSFHRSPGLVVSRALLDSRSHRARSAQHQKSLGARAHGRAHKSEGDREWPAGWPAIGRKVQRVLVSIEIEAIA